MKNFWNTIKKPIFALAPMADVTDAAFRRIIVKYGKPDVLYTEFVSVDGLFSKGRDVLMHDLLFKEEERPIVAQFFTAKPELMEKAAELAVDLGFDGIDINMGCPDRGVEKQGAGAALIKNPKLARELIKATKRGAKGLPVSVKTRIGYNKDEVEIWIPEILKEKPDALIVHARTRKEMSKAPAQWGAIARTREIRDNMKSETLILGNGDVFSLENAKERVKETGCDGVMFGRAIFGNPWFFSGKIPIKKEKLNVLIEHTKLFEELFGEFKNFAVMKKHFKAYVNDFEGAKELRIKLMETNNSLEVEEIINNFLNQ